MADEGARGADGEHRVAGQQWAFLLKQD